MRDFTYPVAAGLLLVGAGLMVAAATSANAADAVSLMASPTHHEMVLSEDETAIAGVTKLVRLEAIQQAAVEEVSAEIARFNRLTNK